eukprot:1906636-Pleurochrysis_carterae.AAC.2
MAAASGASAESARPRCERGQRRQPRTAARALGSLARRRRGLTTSLDPSAEERSLWTWRGRGCVPSSSRDSGTDAGPRRRRCLGERGASPFVRRGARSMRRRRRCRRRPSCAAA